MKDVWIPILVVTGLLLCIGIIATCCVFFSKVWEYINLPRTTLIIKDLPSGATNFHYEGDKRNFEIKHEDKEILGD